MCVWYLSVWYLSVWYLIWPQSFTVYKVIFAPFHFCPFRSCCQRTNLGPGEFLITYFKNCCVANSRRSENFVRFFFFFFVELPIEDYFEVDISNSGVGDVYVWIFKIGILKFHVIRCCGKNSLWMIKDVKIREHFASEVFKIIRYNRYTTTF